MALCRNTLYNNIIYLGIHDPYKSSDFYMFWASLIIECPTIIDSRSIKNLESRALRETILPYRCSFFCNSHVCNVKRQRSSLCPGCFLAQIQVAAACHAEDGRALCRFSSENSQLNANAQ